MLPTRLIIMEPSHFLRGTRELELLKQLHCDRLDQDMVAAVSAVPVQVVEP
jgi:hypothetical protein